MGSDEIILPWWYFAINDLKWPKIAKKWLKIAKNQRRNWAFLSLWLFSSLPVWPLLPVWDTLNTIFLQWKEQGWKPSEEARWLVLGWPLVRREMVKVTKTINDHANKRVKREGFQPTSLWQIHCFWSLLLEYLAFFANFMIKHSVGMSRKKWREGVH